MLTKNITINYRWRSSLIYLLIIASIVSVFTGITTTSQSASAATVTQAKHCIATYYAGSKSGYEIAKRPAGSGSWIDETNGDFNKNSCGDVCTTKTSSRNVPSVGNEQYSVIVQCSTDSKGGGCPGCGPVGTTPPGADTANGAIYDGYNQVVLDKYCPASMSNQIDCITKVNQDTIICIPGDATSAAIDFNTVAKCLEKNSPSSPKITASVIEPLLKKAQASVQSDADSAVAKSKCEKDGSNTWDPTANGGKGTCVSSSGNGQSTCQVDGIGWIICPVMNFMAKVVNAVYSVVSDMLTTPAINTNTNDSNNALYQTWSSFRNIANIAFVVAFLIIIYSQITSVGITNYGIKKMLPRIIIAAILVNVSYWICAIAIDLSNIVGSSVVGLFNGITPKTTSTGSNFNGGNGVINWVGGTAAVLAVVGVALYAGLTVLLPIIITAVVAILTVVIVLTARQAIIILLVAVAPLAFVAFLLPNTEKWFKKWRETFVAMLVMFPVIAAVFGASKLASAVIMKTAGDNVTLQIMGAGVSIIPLIISPIVMKASTGVLGKIGGFVNNPNKGPFDRMRKGAAGIRERRQNIRKGAALSGSGRVFGGGQFRRAERSNLRNQAAEAQAKSGASAFARHDDKAISLDQQARTANSWASTHDTMRDVAWRQSAAGSAAVQGQMNAETEGKAVKVNAEIQNISTAPGLRLNLAATEAQLGSAKAEEGALIKELQSDKGRLAHPEIPNDVGLQIQHATENQHLNEMRANSAERQAQEEMADKMQNAATGFATYAGGIAGHGDTRAVAQAIQSEHKAFDEAVGAYKTTMTSDSATDLVLKMKNASLSEEERSAAAGQLAKVGSDKDLHDAFEYLGTHSGSDISTIQKQFAADVSNRKPTSIGASDMSNLTRGEYTGTFESKITTRVDNGKQTGASLAGAGPDELVAIHSALKIAPKPVAGSDAEKYRTLLKDSITKYYTAAERTGKPVSGDIKKLMDNIHGEL